MHIERSALLPYPAAEVYALVNDIESYPQYLKWCKAARTLESGDHLVVAELTLAGRGLKETLVTRNSLVPNHSISMTLAHGPFRHFSGTWTFTTLGPGCRVRLALEFEPKRSFFTVFGTAHVLGRVADETLDGFVRRAREVLSPA
ncbi:MAG: type II toxin-antitoxin system RatA family toxin [Gammaproteobacteria bacterium]|nr:type II toxin-antitoxin system RatA family toxin [Gammaproteobacteria bacterium]